MISIFTGAYFFGEFRRGGPRLPLKLCDVFGRLSYSLLLPLPAVLGFARRFDAEADLDDVFTFDGDAYLEPLCFAAVVLGLLEAFLSFICFLVLFVFGALFAFNGSSSSKKFFKNSFFSRSTFVASFNFV